MNAIDSREASRLNDSFLEEYNSQDSILKYTRKTAGHGISYLLQHEYGPIYVNALKKHTSRSRLKSGVRIWEFGCGAGMNLLHLVAVLERQGIPVEFACGTDFSEALIAAAKSETRNYLPLMLASKVRFTVARNEDLVAGGVRGLGLTHDNLIGSFDLVLGVNTIRYGHRMNNVERCVQGIGSLLHNDGVCVVIDMNQGFPAFRSRLREVMNNPDEKATYIPTLDEYAEPFSKGGFQILQKKNFCWVPHSAGRTLTGAMRVATPLLNMVARRRAMRSLVISRK